ncbi:MAG: nucleotidyltransferase [Chitinophagaceae bacterium]|nr:nucleotidyltransferase [Chitinophagaceae bacterium]
MIFDQNYIDFINLLNKAEVRYVLVGGLAVVIHGHFRSTKDMDLFYKASEENAKKVLGVINEFGFSYLRLTVEDLMDYKGYIKLGNAPVRIDLFCDLPGVSFDEVYEEAIDYSEEGVRFKVIHINHLLTNKKFVGRLQDLDDVKKLTKIIAKKKK